MKKTLLLLCALVASQLMSAQLFLNEIFLSPPEADAPNEYIEVRGVPNAIIPAGTYIVTVDGDFETSSGGNDVGDIEADIMDLSGLQLGSNGILVLLATGNPYQAAGLVDSNATVVLDLNDGNIEDQSHTILLINTSTPPSSSDDIDANNDGTPDGVYLNWTVLDGVAFCDDDAGGITAGNNEFAYADVVYAESNIVPNLLVPPGATVISTSTQYDYAARIGDNNGNTVNNDASVDAVDWVGGDIPSGGTTAGVPNNLPNWVLGSNSSSVRTHPESFEGLALNHIGAPNPGQSLTLSSEDFDTVNFSIFPNPAKSEVNILASNQTKIDGVELYNLLGRRVLQIKELVNNKLNIEGLTSGVYLLKVKSENSSITRKLIIE